MSEPALATAAASTTPEQEGPTRRRRRVPKVVRVMIALIALLLVAAGIEAAPASAATVVGITSGSEIVVVTGAKNSSNHTQYVNGIMVVPPNNGAYCDTVDAWTQNWYSGQVTGCSSSYYFAINRWVATGNYVCGRVTEYHYGTTGTACIAIRV